MQEALTRRVELPQDLDALLRLDTSFTSSRIFQAKATEGEGLQLASAAVAVPIEKSFPVHVDADPWRDGWVIEEGGAIRGFVACAHNTWNNRIVIWHFYVDRPHRHQGFGRRLMDVVISHGRSLGASTAWLETTNLNYPGVLAYERLGFEICGFDLTIYRGTPNEGEFGLFLAREV